MSWRAWIVLAVLGMLPLGAFGLTADEVAILVNSKSAGSAKVADYYAKVRGVPAAQVIALPMPAAETISAADYEGLVAGPLRRELRLRGLERKVLCVVPTFDVPLRVDNQMMTEAEQRELAQRKGDLQAALQEIQTLSAKYGQILIDGGAGATAPATPQGVPPLTELLKRAGILRQAAMERLNAASGEDKAKAAPSFFTIDEQLIGPAGVLGTLKFTNETPEANAVEAQERRILAEAQQAEKRVNSLTLDLDNPANRQEILDLRRKYGGLIAFAKASEGIITVIQHDQSHACLDSELMMLWVEHYARARWLPNPKCVSIWPYMAEAGRKAPIMMVSRLDGSSVPKVLGMIDTSMEVEKKGLDGAVYIDARGLHGTDGYAEFDAELRQAANYLHDNTNLKVVLDDKPGLLQASDCPDAAFYCGWYSLHHYIDSCQWLPGAVGYHVASAEMNSLHAPGETGWVVNLLDRGVCGTLGAVEEPYLSAFPRPSLFFPLVLSGEYTQAEVYFVTAPVVSWCVGYVGDPLYNPCKVKPRITAKQLREHLQLRFVGEILRGARADVAGTQG